MAVSSNSIFVNEGLFLEGTEKLIKKEKLLDVSLTSVFSIDIKAKGKSFAGKIERVNFLAYEAVLPGRSFQTGEINSIQGVSQKYPTSATYADVDISFYVTRDYDTLTFFSAWMEAISPVEEKSSGIGYLKFNYPDSYVCDVNIIKYERDMRPANQRLTSKPETRFSGSLNDPTSYTHSLINAYPINIISIPLSYSQSDILRTTITFNYDRYVVQKNPGRMN
jgi:hypothetical protein